MARVALIKVFFSMTLTGAQLAGELKKHGHEPLVINFKNQEIVPQAHWEDPQYQRGDLPMVGVSVTSKGCSVNEMSIWKKATETEYANLKDALDKFKPDAIGLTFLSHAMTFGAQITEELRKHFDVPILWGGTGPTIEPERSIESADLVCVGEGEEVIVEIADRLEQGKSLAGIDGTWFRHPDGTVQKNPKRPVSDLSKIARPLWDHQYNVFISGDKYLTNFLPEDVSFDKSYKIMTQRGCPFSCSFCVESFYQKEFGKKGSLRRMPPMQAIEELRYAKNVLGYKTVTFFDDVFTVNPRWLDEFLPLYKKEIDLPFFAYTYPTTHNVEMLKKMRDAGCHAITMGVQSGSERILKDVYDRPTKTNRIIEAAYEILEAGIPAASFDMIPKTDWDTEEDLKRTLEFMYEMPKEIDTSFYAELTLFPNYPIYEVLEKNQIAKETSTLDRDTYDYYYKLFNLTRSKMPMEKVRELANNPYYREDHTRLDQFLTDDDLLKPIYGKLIKLGMKRVREQAKAQQNTQQQA